jgi:hypothetical protein
METIQAKVSKKLLPKASRLFTGTLDGRVIEILQNSRRAGATEVQISNKDGLITVADNGGGIDDFSKLLNLGDSDWDDAMEKSEDPAGVGLFSLAPREVTIISKFKMVVITKEGWTGDPMEVTESEEFIRGTKLEFRDENPWDMVVVEKHAVFSGLVVTVDGQQCSKESFCTKGAADYPALGCKVEVCHKKTLNKWHTHFRHGYYSNDVLVNFHGQVISFTDSPVSDRELTFVVDMTGDPTGIRLMLPARTQLIENKAFNELKAAIEIEAYRFIQKQGSHKLPFKEYERAKKLGIDLPEAEPVFEVGLLYGENIEPIEITRPEDFPLSKCYRLSKDCEENSETDEANMHLLAATGKFKEAFVPVKIRPAYDGYSWTNLPVVNKVEVTVGKEIGRQGIWSETLVAVDSLQIAVQTSDAKTFKSDVLMAVLGEPVEKRSWCCMNVYITLEARCQLSTTDIWFHLGGWNDEGDTWDTQKYQVEQELEEFWATIIGPAEYLRSKLRECLYGVVKDWKQIIFDDNEAITITYKDGKVKSYESPYKNSAAN